MPMDIQTLDLEHASAFTADCYVGADTLALEQRVVFQRSWQLIAHAGQLVHPGDLVVGAIGSVPILLVRGQDRVLRGFVNVCRHRAGPLALDDAHGLRNLCCKYHGWTYTLDGRLRGAPEMQDAKDFDAGAIRLHGLCVHEWQGLVFAALDPATPAFDDVYAGIAERIQPIELGTMRFFRRVSYDVACNWKVYVDNYVEGYHLPQVHPGLSRILDYRSYATELSRWYSLQYSPLRSGDVLYGDGDAFYCFAYPNTMLNIMSTRLQTNRVLPLGPSRCRVLFDFYYAPGEDAAGRIDADQAFSDEVQREDIAICERVQQGLASGCYSPGRLCAKRESGVWHFQNLLRAAYAAGGGVAA
jgi:choline monooxygenase